jgi:hypothetical protein
MKVIAAFAAVGATIGYILGGSFGVVGYGFGSSGAPILGLLFGVIGGLAGWVYTLRHRP